MVSIDICLMSWFQVCRLHFLILCWAEKTYHCFWQNSILMTFTWNSFNLMKQFLCWNGFLTFHSHPLSHSILIITEILESPSLRLDLLTTQDYSFRIIENPRQHCCSLCSSRQSQWSQICITSLAKTVGSESQEKSAFTLFSSLSKQHENFMSCRKAHA